MIWSMGKYAHMDILHDASKFRISIPGYLLPREHVQTLHDIVHPMVAKAYKSGVSVDLLRKSGKELTLYIFDVPVFEEECKRHYRRWMASLADGSPLDLWVSQ
jgi:hypothetical protein